MRTALIGLGRIGWGYHLRQIVSHQDYTLSAVVDTSQERLDEAKTLYGAEGFTDYRQMLEQVRPDLVVIASPTVFHEEQAIAAMESGADVLLDKPMTIGYDSACRIAAVQKKTQKKLVIYQPRRFNPAVQAAKSIIASGKLGPIFRMRVGREGYSRRNDWQAFRKFGGGMLSNYGAHHIDELVYLSQSKIAEFSCKLHKILSLGDAEDVAHVRMVTENGTLLDVDINQATCLPDLSLRLYGTYGTAILHNSEDGEYFQLKYCDPDTLEEKTASDDLAAAGRQYPRDNIAWINEKIMVADFPEPDFYGDCAKFFLKDAPSPVPLEETLRIMELIELGYQQNENMG